MSPYERVNSPNVMFFSIHRMGLNGTIWWYYTLYLKNITEPFGWVCTRMKWGEKWCGMRVEWGKWMDGWRYVTERLIPMALVPVLSSYNKVDILLGILGREGEYLHCHLCPFLERSGCQQGDKVMLGNQHQIVYVAYLHLHAIFGHCESLSEWVEA